MNFKPYNHFIKNYGKITQAEMTGKKVVLYSPYFDKVWLQIFEEYKPSKRNIIFSMCTKKRPYYTSIKWMGLRDNFGANSDFAVLSTAGIIPMEYGACYPFTEYQVMPSEFCDPEEYQNIIGGRLQYFVNKHYSHWDNIVFLMDKSSLRRWKPIIEWLNQDKIKLLPSSEVYQKAAKNAKKSFFVFRRYPVLHPYILKEVAQYIPFNTRKGLF